MAIRRQPGEFRVDEQIALAPSAYAASDSPPAFALYRLTKTQLTTPEACQRLARALGVRPGTVEYAGLKDKHAVTTQYVSVAHRGSATPARVEGPGWTGEFVGVVTRHLRAEDIEFNRFAIVMRDLARPAANEMTERAAALVGPGGSLRVVNYFGDQRFGSARHGEGFAARKLIAGDFEGAIRLLIATPARKDTGLRRTFTRLAASKWGDWHALARDLPRCPDRRAIEILAAGGHPRDAFASLPFMIQQLAVESFQSFLWNATAAHLMLDLSHAASIEPLRADDDFGEMIFPTAAVWDAPSLKDRSCDFARLELPMLSAETRLVSPWGNSVQAVLAREGVLIDQLRIPGLRRPAFREARRPLLVNATEFRLGPVEPDELYGRMRVKREVRFALPRGAYATVVLRALGQ